MSDVEALQSGKGHRDENFPVASVLIHPRHRPAILAFYQFVRAADDIADNATAEPADKLRLLERMHKSLMGEDDVPEGVALRVALAARGLTSQHAEDLLEAFRRDVTKLRYNDWDDLCDYCRYSANPVGRYVLDVHGESRELWPYNDKLCTALQIINHLQDCADDYRNLDRVYIPLDALSAAGIGTDVLASQSSSPALRGVITGLAERVSVLLKGSKPFARGIQDTRLGLEVSVIQELAEDLTKRLKTNDPLSDRVHHRKAEALGLAALAAGGFAVSRLMPRARVVKRELRS
ncbi:MAG: squalene synthase HpnC [Alphaproteobacteria bacterium]